MGSIGENLYSFPPMIDRLTDHFSFEQAALRVRQQRQEILASNIANADTPGYKARDLSFRDALKAATAGTGRLPDTHLTRTSARHIPASAKSTVSDALLYRQPLQPRLDGNTVDMDVERVQFADNTARYQAELTVLSTRLKTMMAALQQ